MNMVCRRYFSANCLHSYTRAAKCAEELMCISGQESVVGHLRDLRSVKGVFVSVHVVYSRLFRLNIAHEQLHISDRGKHAVTLLALYLHCRYLEEKTQHKNKFESFQAAASFSLNGTVLKSLGFMFRNLTGMLSTISGPATQLLSSLGPQPLNVF